MDKKQGISALYDTWHKPKIIISEINTPWHSFVASRLSDFVLDGKRILEIGCGRGEFACWFAATYSSVYKEFVAADFSKVAIEKGRNYALSKGIVGINWTIQDIMRIDYPENYFDIVISCETIEHVPKPFNAILELYRVTKRGGFLILTTPNYGNFMGLYRGWLRLTGRRFTEIGQPINKFVFYAKTKMWLRLSGFKVDYASTLNISYPSPLFKREVQLKWRKPK